MRYHLPGATSPSQVSLASPALHAQVAIVGAGPRGTSSLERLCASAPDFLKNGTRLTVHVIDPYPAGAGAVWRTTQSTELLMNTVASQVTLFTDESVECEGPVRSGPSLYEWAVEQGVTGLGPDDYPTRGQYGRYLRWVFGEILRRAPSNFKVIEHEARATRLDEGVRGGHQKLTLSNGRTLSGLSAVILAQGHLPLQEDPKQDKITQYAKQHDLKIIPPSNPADVDLSKIKPGESVVFRGLGLNFFDYMALLTTGRGGRFLRTETGLRYEPSGNEPRMWAGSRRGIPYQARGDNAKGPYGRHTPLVITEDVVAGFRKRAENGDMPDFMREIWPLVAKEVEVVYYETVLSSTDDSERHDFRRRFLATTHKSPEEIQVLDEFSVPQDQRWCWDRITRPYGTKTFEDSNEWRHWMLDYLREDAKQAALGNVEGPLKAALDVMRDLRNELRLIVDHRGVSGNSRREHLDGWYTPFNAYLSIGPPRQRVEQMIALIEAGLLDVVGPRIQIQSEDGAWLASSPEIPGPIIRATTLVEARLPDINLRKTGDDLLSNMLKDGLCRPHIVDGHETEGLDVSASPYHVIDAAGASHERRFAVGVPTEGVHWVTAAGARPGVNSVTLLDTDAVARATLTVVKSEIGVVRPTLSSKSRFMSELSVMQKRVLRMTRLMSISKSNRVTHSLY